MIMQGSVFGNLICTSVMDKLAKLFYNDPNLLYKYKNDIEVLKTPRPFSIMVGASLGLLSFFFF